MQPRPADDPQAPWIALMCVGILLTSLSATVCVGLIVLYNATIEGVQPVLACFAVGAVLMLGAAAGLDVMAITSGRTRRR